MNLKKCTSILLVFLLLVSSTGFAFNVHFCGGNIASVSLKPEVAKADKGCCGMKAEKSNCCKSKVVHFQKKSDNTIAKSFAFQAETAIFAQSWQPITYTLNDNFKSDSNISYYCDANAPPLFKLYSQYLLYDKV
jgi:hypothetical protein